MEIVFNLLLRFLPLASGDPSDINCDRVMLFRKGIPVWSEPCPSLHLTTMSFLDRCTQRTDKAISVARKCVDVLQGIKNEMEPGR